VKFHLSAEQEQLQDELQRILADCCSPARRRAVVNSDSDFDQSIWTALMAFGLGGMLVPEGYGGSATGLLDVALACEVLGKHATPGPIMSHLLAALAIAESADESLQSKWLPRIATGEVVAAFVPGVGWLPESWDLEAAQGKINGKVDMAIGADSATLFVFGVRNSGFALVEKSDRVIVTSLPSSDVTRRVATIGLENADCAICGPSSFAAHRVLDAGLVMLAADALGGAQQCLNMSVDYASSREQFGTVIGSFQAIKHQLANMALEVESSRGLAWFAAHAFDVELPEASRVAAVAKAHLADRYVSVARQAVQVHGGMGYTWEYDMNLWFRRSLTDRAYLGAPSLHRERAAELAQW
jgi:alkylation response protein AidB-like acyl-CoA dehydrogenase